MTGNPAQRKRSGTVTNDDTNHVQPRISTLDVERQTKSDRAERGKRTRQHIPRSAHDAWSPGRDRADPVAQLEQDERELIEELVPIRHARMLASPFTFYRGSASLMAADLASLPRTDLTVQLCGDAHLSNFGAYGAPDRRLVFSLNDFDETLPGPFEWDVKRLVTSFAIAGLSRGFRQRDRRAIELAAAREYRRSMRDFAKRGVMDVWYARLNLDQVIGGFADDAIGRQRKAVKRVVAKTRSRDSRGAMKKLTEVVDGELRFVSDPPLLVRLDDLVNTDEATRINHGVAAMLASYRESLQENRRHLFDRFECVDIARKVVGVGSVGTRAWVALLIGRDRRDPLLLQFKEARTSALEPHLGRSEYDNHGRRVVTGQRLMQSASDIMLGWHRTAGIDGVERDFYMRQLWDQKGSAAVDKMNPEGMGTYARMCGWTLARAHARSGDAISIASYLGKSDRFDRAMAEFAEAYAEQNDQDYHRLRDAIAAADGVDRVAQHGRT